MNKLLTSNQITKFSPVWKKIFLNNNTAATLTADSYSIVQFVRALC